MSGAIIRGQTFSNNPASDGDTAVGCVLLQICCFRWRYNRLLCGSRRVFLAFLKEGFLISFFFFFNIVLTWKIVEASEASVLYIYIYIDYNDIKYFFLKIILCKM